MQGMLIKSLCEIEDYSIKLEGLEISKLTIKKSREEI